MGWKMAPGKWWPFCPGRDAINISLRLEQNGLYHTGDILKFILLDRCFFIVFYLILLKKNKHPNDSVSSLVQWK